jgi:hypothetical protein
MCCRGKPSGSKYLDTGFYPPLIKGGRGDLRVSQLEKSPFTPLS